MNEKDLKTIYGKNIKKFREEKNLTQAQLAEEIGIAEKYLSTLETCDKWGSFDTLLALANALEIEPYELFLPQNQVVSYDSRRTKQLMVRFRKSLNELVDTVEEFLEDK
ncbi:MAG: helix-turn-helix transcriptional regulator [Treponema sp.]|nr:helix-turn-helix transcriptional regulator [Treponema sp.]